MNTLRQTRKLNYRPDECLDKCMEHSQDLKDFLNSKMGGTLYGDDIQIIEAAIDSIRIGAFNAGTQWRMEPLRETVYFEPLPKGGR